MKPRIRTIKPEAAKDEELWDLGIETGLPVFQAFVTLWCQCDREGRFEWRPRALKADCLPFWEGDFSRVLDALWSRGFVLRYASQGREFGVVRTFTQHQAINGKEPPSQLPEPSESNIIPYGSRVNDASKTGTEHVADVPIRSLPFRSLPDPIPQGGAGGGESPRPVAPSGAFQLPRDWDPGDGVFVGTSVPPWAHPELLSRFRAYHCNGGARRSVTDWRQSYAKWGCGEWAKNPPQKPANAQTPADEHEAREREEARRERDAAHQRKLEQERDERIRKAGIDPKATGPGDIAKLLQGIGN